MKGIHFSRALLVELLSCGIMVNTQQGRVSAGANGKRANLCEICMTSEGSQCPGCEKGCTSFLSDFVASCPMVSLHLRTVVIRVVHLLAQFFL